MAWMVYDDIRMLEEAHLNYVLEWAAKSVYRSRYFIDDLLRICSSEGPFENEACEILTWWFIGEIRKDIKKKNKKGIYL